jgi:hypothetical protein
MATVTGSVLLLTGPPGAGKTTVADLVASRFTRSAHVEADRFFGFVVGGYLDPWDPESHGQNGLVMDIACDAAARYAEAGYLTVLEGIFIPGWFYEPVRDRLRGRGLHVAAALLRPSRATTLERARRRMPPKLLPDEVLERLWNAFAEAGPLAAHVIERDERPPEEVANVVVRRLADGSLAV